MSEINLKQCPHEDEGNCAHCGYNMRDLDADISYLRAALDLASEALEYIVFCNTTSIVIPHCQDCKKKAQEALQSIRSARGKE